jgi:hypothetical protein
MRSFWSWLSVGVIALLITGTTWAGNTERLPFGSSVYQRVESVTMSWHQARDFCASQGGHLATIHSQEEHDFVFQNLVFTTDPAEQRRCWIGLTDEVVEGTWKWVTGEPFSFQAWDNLYGGPEPNGGCYQGSDFAEIYSWQPGGSGGNPLRLGRWNDNGSRGSGACYSCGCFASYDPGWACTLCEWELGACCTNGPGTASECVLTTQLDCQEGRGLYLGDKSDCDAVLSCTALEVTMLSMSAHRTDGGTLLIWTTTREIDTLGFRVLRERARSSEKSIEVLVEMIPASGFGLTGDTYQFLDNARMKSSGVQYYIEEIDIFGRVTRYGPIVIQRKRSQDHRETRLN